MIWVTLAHESLFRRAISAWLDISRESRRAFHCKACWRTFFTRGVKPGPTPLLLLVFFPLFKVIW